MLGNLCLSSLPNMASHHSKSKKQSDGSRRQPPLLPEDFVLYLDENLHNCKPILDALVGHGVKYERHGTHSPPGTEDPSWLPSIGNQPCAALPTVTKTPTLHLE